MLLMIKSLPFKMNLTIHGGSAEHVEPPLDLLLLGLGVADSYVALDVALRGGGAEY